MLDVDPSAWGNGTNPTAATGDGIIGAKKKPDEMDYKQILKDMAKGYADGNMKTGGGGSAMPPYMQGAGNPVPFGGAPQPYVPTAPQAPGLPQGSLLEKNQKQRNIPTYMR